MFHGGIKSGLLILIIIAIFYVLFILYYHFPEDDNKTVISSKNTTTYVMNLDKNPERLQKMTQNYQASDISEIPMKRFPAILGANVDIQHWLTPEAITELERVEKKKYRTHHYQLTRGAVGCFLSHYTLAKQLLSDKRNDYYIIMEDDSVIDPNGFKTMQEAMINAPENWDIILFGFIRIVRPEMYGNFIRPEGFWGLHGYIMNKQGAKKIVDETDTILIDGQLDAYISRMVQQKKINVYAYKDPVVFQSSVFSTIQMGIRLRENVNPYDYKGYIV